MEQWLPMQQAAKELNVSMTKLSSMVQSGQIEVRRSNRDNRVKLVNLAEIRKLFNTPVKAGES